MGVYVGAVRRVKLLHDGTEIPLNSHFRAERYVLITFL